MALGIDRTALVWSNFTTTFVLEDTRMTLMHAGGNTANIMAALQSLSNAILELQWTGLNLPVTPLANPGTGYQTVKWQVKILWEAGSLATGFGIYGLTIPGPQTPFLSNDLASWAFAAPNPNADLDIAVHTKGMNQQGFVPTPTEVGHGLVFHHCPDVFQFPETLATWIRTVLWEDREGNTTLTHIQQSDTLLDILDVCKTKSNCFARETFVGNPVAVVLPSPPISGYLSVWDNAEVRYGCADGSTLVMNIPAPIASVFDSTKEVVDQVGVSALSTAVVGFARSRTGSVATKYIGGRRNFIRRY